MERAGAMSRAGRGRGAAIVATLSSIAAWPAVAEACVVCFGGKDSDWPGAFVAGTLIMLGLPPAIVIGAGIAIYRATKRQQARRTAVDANSA